MKPVQLIKKFSLLFSLLVMASTLDVRAQANVSVYATGLTSPIGLEIDAQGWLWVGEEGTGNNDSRVSVVTTDGQVHPFLTGLPSELVEGDPLGAEHLYLDVNGNLLIMQGEGSDFLSESVLTISTAGFSPGDTSRKIDDLKAIHKIGRFSLSQGAATTNPYALAIGPDDNLYIVDAGLNGIVKLERCTGNLSVFATFDPIPNPTSEGPPVMDAVPTGIVHSGSKFYVGLFVGFPFLPDSSRIVQVDLNGNVAILKNGLTSVVDLAIDPRDGNLVFLQFARWEFPFAPNSGGVFKLKNGAVDTIAYGLNFPTGLRFNNSGDLFVSSFADGQILKITSSLAAAQWRLQTTLSGNPALVSVKAVSRDVAWIAGFDGIVYRTTDGGRNWIPTTKASTTEALGCIEALDANTAFAGGGGPDWSGVGAKIYRTVNGGQSWEAVYTPTTPNSFWNWIHFFDSQNGIAQSDPPVAGGNFLIVKTTNGGTTWTPIANPPDANENEFGIFNGFHFYDNLNGWFGTGHPPFVPGGSAGRVFRTTDGGNTWTAFASGNAETVNAVRFVSPTVGIRTSDSPPFLTRSVDGGQTWTPVSGLPVSNIRQMIAATGVKTPSLNQLWVYGEADSPFILSSTDGGATWQQQTIGGRVVDPIYHISAVSFGASSDSVQAFGITFDISTLARGGQIYNYRNRLGVLTAVKEERPNLPLEYILSQNYPNPFNPETRIRYELPQSSRVVLKVFNMLGQEVRALANEFRPAGSYEVSWDGRDNAGQRMPSGMYLYRIEAEGLVQTKKMVLLQ
jgi:photosystem II stability/assembly factor-like uncharacterized protein